MTPRYIGDLLKGDHRSAYSHSFYGLRSIGIGRINSTSSGGSTFRPTSYTLQARSSTRSSALGNDISRVGIRLKPSARPMIRSVFGRWLIRKSYSPSLLSHYVIRELPSDPLIRIVFKALWSEYIITRNLLPIIIQRTSAKHLTTARHSLSGFEYLVSASESLKDRNMTILSASRYSGPATVPPFAPWS